MKQIVLESPRKFAEREVEMPSPGPGEALVKIVLVGVCGSDIHLYRLGRIGAIQMTEPLVIGHESVGIVEKTGPGVAGDLVGKKVAVEPEIFCGKCRWCKELQTNLCPDNRFLGLPPTPGAMQEYLVHPAHLVVELPDNVSDEAGVVLEPVAIALHAVKLAKIKGYERVAILGTGVLGTCVLELLGQYDGLHIVASDLVEDRLKRARSMGAAEVIQVTDGARDDASEQVLAALGGHGADIVFECSGSADTLYSMCEVAAPGAHVVVIGSNPEDEVSFSSGSARRKGLTLRFVRRSLNTLDPAIDLAAWGKIHPEKLVTHHFPASEAAKAFETVGNYADGVLKAVIDINHW